MDMTQTNQRVIAQFRSGGPIDGMDRDRILLLTTRGRRSAQERTTPMMFHRDGDRIVVIASNLGAHHHPDWYQNLVADPRARVELGQDSYAARADPLVGADRDRVWADLTRLFPFFAEHETAAAPRVIPVVALDREAA